MVVILLGHWVSSNSHEKIEFCLRQCSWVRNPTIIPGNTLLEFFLPAATNVSSSRRFYFIREECFHRRPNSGSFELVVETTFSPVGAPHTSEPKGKEGITCEVIETMYIGLCSQFLAESS